VNYFKAKSQHLVGDSENNHENLSTRGDFWSEIQTQNQQK